MQGLVTTLPPIVKMPSAEPPFSAVPVESSPVTDQIISSGDGNAGAGVQVSVVWSLLHEEVAVSVAKFVSRNDATVTEVFIALLNVKTTGALGETPEAPFAGTTETRVGACARTCPTKPKLITPRTARNPANRKTRTKREIDLKIISATESNVDEGYTTCPRQPRLFNDNKLTRTDLSNRSSSR